MTTITVPQRTPYTVTSTSIIATTDTTQLSREHQRYLTAAAISLDVAVASGVKTVRCADDLPDTLRGHFGDDTRGGRGGILLPHGHLDGGQSFTYRPDNPQKDEDGRARKYLKEADRQPGQALSIHPDMLARVGQGHDLVLVEGDKGYLSAVTNAPAGALIAGVPGCWGWSFEGMAVPDLLTLAKGAKNVFISFDGDVRGGDVRDAAERLTEALKTFGIENVRYVLLPASTKLSLDDYLAGYPEAERQGIFENLIHNAAKTLGRKPAAKKKARVAQGVQAGECAWEEGVMRNERIVHTDSDGSTRITGGEIILEAAIRQVRSIMVTDDLLARPEGPVRSSVIEVAVGEEGTPDRRECTVEVAHDLLQSPRALLGKTNLEAVAYTHVPHASSPKTEVLRQIIAESQGSPACDSERRIAHTGWTTMEDGRAGFLHEGGCITALGNSDEVSATVAGQGRECLAFTDPAMVADKALAMSALYELKTTVSPAVFYGLLGAIFRGLGGLPAGGSLNLVGDPGSGKTEIVKMFLHCLPQPVEVTLGAHTEAALRKFSEGLHGLPMLFDDLAITSDERRTEGTVRSFIDYARAAYDGPSSRRLHTVEASSPGKRELANMQLNDVFPIFTSEYGLDRDPSTMERICTVRHPSLPVVQARINAEIGWKIAASGRLHEAFVLVIQELARQADETAVVIDATSLEALRFTHEALRKNVRDTVQQIAEGTGLSSRRIEVIATVVMGVGMFVSAWGEIDDDSMSARGLSAWGEIESAAKALVAQSADSTDDPGALMLDSMRQAVASGAVRIHTDGLEPKFEDKNKDRIGYHRNVRRDDGTLTPCVAFMPDRVAGALPTRTSARQVTRALSSRAIKDANGKATRSVRIDGVPTNCLVLPLAVWEGEGQEEPGGKAA